MPDDRRFTVVRYITAPYPWLAAMTEMMTSTAMEDMHLGAKQDRNSYQIFPDPTDFERCCKLQDCLPSIVVEPTEGEVESGELRWPPEDFLLAEESKEEKRECNGGQLCPNTPQ
ncbi:protein LBH-like isoform X2 [Brienomyrus brachyistius]|uniref:protein LBH-like isoform X2 n=2 Tax=Brienomyrus brachyistius TaxID=42636 RepID=UPI0020B1BB9A|nr:protein LBH-like isoform X2 [Brienomyrus brachyistius]